MGYDGMPDLLEIDALFTDDENIRKNNIKEALMDLTPISRGEVIYYLTKGEGKLTDAVQKIMEKAPAKEIVNNASFEHVEIIFDEDDDALFYKPDQSGD